LITCSETLRIGDVELRLVRPAEPEALWSFGGHAPACLCSNRCQALAALPAAVAENGLAAPARIAAQKPVLPFSPDFRWLILSFHKQFKLADP